MSATSPKGPRNNSTDYDQDLQKLVQESNSPDEDLFSALTRMISNGVGRLPVVLNDNQQSLVEIITPTDVGKAIEKHRSAPVSHKIDR
ncbi:MAG: CBS domain-containing protein [Candidatus Bathyarchaeia archaeon]|jgi:predicted transcriptional regulator